MKSTTILALAIIFSRRFSQLENDYICKLIEVLLLLIKEQNKESFNSVLAFLKLFGKLASKDLLKSQLGLILEAVFTWDEVSHNASRGIVKNLIKIFHRKLVNNFFRI